MRVEMTCVELMNLMNGGSEVQERIDVHYYCYYLNPRRPKRDEKETKET